MSVHSDNHTTYSDPSTDVDEFYQTDFYSEDGDVSDIKLTKRELAAQVDSGKHVIYKRRGKKNYRIVVYSTNGSPGRLIRNAVNGSTYLSYRVGSADEDLFFSVILASGETGKTPAILFYDTPEQYEAHFHVSLSDEAKRRWLVKFNDARRLLEEFDRKTNTYLGVKAKTDNSLSVGEAYTSTQHMENGSV